MPETYYNRPVFGWNSLQNTYNLWGSGFYAKPTFGRIGTEDRVCASDPLWKWKIAHKIDATNDYTRRWLKPTGGWVDVKVDSTNGWGWSRVSGYWSTNGSYDDPQVYNDAVTRDIALLKIKRKIASDREDYAVMENLLQDVYEFQKTIHGTLDSIKNLVENVQHMAGRRGRGGKAGILRNIADLYLEWTFGINPTIQDAKELATSIQAYIDRKDHFKRFVGSHYANSAKSSISILSPGIGIGLEVNEIMTRNYSVKYVSAHNMLLRSGNNYDAYKHFHLAPGAFVPTLWELLPWSWLVDYVINVGDFLEDIFLAQVDYSLYNVQDIKTTVNYRVEMKPIISSGWKLNYFKHDPRVANAGSLFRTHSATLPARMLRFRTMYEINNNLGKKLLNILAVAATKTLR